MGTGSQDLRSVSPPYAFVGDLHGRVALLKTILDKDPSRRYHYVFLGDTIHHKPYFRRSKRTSPIKMFKALADMIESGRATLVLGNNENYVLRALVMPDQNIKKRELKYTMKCLKDLPLGERLRYISMLSNAPLYLELNSRYRLAHAYYPHAQQSVSRDTIISGPGYLWFKDQDLFSKHCIDPSYLYFFGHYGLPYRRSNVSIIDATSLEATGVYYTDKDELVTYY